MERRFEAIGWVRSPFKEKFGIPRQAGLVPEISATVEIAEAFAQAEAFRGLEEFSHLWLVFAFHASAEEGWKPTVRPPRLGGNERRGVFATRSPYRPNPIGLSAVALEGIERAGARLELRVRGADLLDGTPVLDIKPYLPYADSIPLAKSGFAAEAPGPGLRVRFSAAAAQQCREREQRDLPGLEGLIRGILQQDPRPAYRRGPRREDGGEDESYGMRLHDLDVKWRVEGGVVSVVGLWPATPDPGGESSGAE